MLWEPAVKGPKVTCRTEGEEISGGDLPGSLMMERSFKSDLHCSVQSFSTP